MDYKQAESGLLLPPSYVTETVETEYGMGSRVSMPWNQQRQTFYNRVHPDASGTLKNTRIDTKKLQNKPIKEVIRILAKAAASMSDALDLYRQYINSGHTWDTESTADERRLEDMEERCTIGGVSFQTIINQFIFGMLIEGAFCGEITGNRVEGIFRISPVSPLEITFTQDEDPKIGVIDIIGQGVGKNFKSLQDPRTPNPYFIYDPVSNDSTEPWGAIPFLPGIAAEIMHSELFTKTNQYLDGQIFPKGYFSFDLAQLNRAQLDPKTIIKWVNESATALQDRMSSADITQSIITKVPTLWTLVGSLGKVNLDGLEMLDRMISRSLQRSYKVPAFLFDLGNQGGIQSGRERTEMLLWLRRIRNYQRMINEALTQWGNIELRIQGSRGKCGFMLDDSDLEGERLIAEYDQLQAQARHTQAQADQVYIQAGVVTQQEVRETLIEKDERYANLPRQIPDPMPEPDIEETDPEETDPESEDEQIAA